MRRLFAVFYCLFCGSLFSAPVIPKIYVGYYMKSILIDSKEEKAAIDFYYWYRFDIPKDTSLIKTLASVEYVNGDLQSNEVHETKIIGNQYYIAGRAKGEFGFIADYTAYPFDKQIIPIQLEHTMLTSDQVEIVVDSQSYLNSGVSGDKWGLSPDLNFKDMIFVKSLFQSDSRLYNTNFGDFTLTDYQSKYSQMSCNIYVKRNSIPYMLKFLIPLIIILGLAYLVFFIEADNLELACGLTVTSLLAAIAFQWTVSDDLPNVGYLSCADKVFYLGYVLIMLAMVQTVWTYHLEKSGKEKLALRMEMAGRWLFPILFFGVTAIFITLAINY